MIFWRARCEPGRAGGRLRDGAGAATDSCPWASRSRDLIGGEGEGEDGNGHSREERGVHCSSARLCGTASVNDPVDCGPTFSNRLSFSSFFFSFYFARVVGCEYLLCNFRNRLCVVILHVNVASFWKHCVVHCAILVWIAVILVCIILSHIKYFITYFYGYLYEIFT